MADQLYTHLVESAAVDLDEAELVVVRGDVDVLLRAVRTLVQLERVE